MQRLLDLLSLDDVADRSVDQLSGGQRQRVAVARSVAVEPDVLLLDEPLGALDANLRARMQRELKRIQKQLGITFVFVTHAQSEAMAMADTIVVMNAGRIEQIGSPADIFGQPTTRFTAQFVGNNNIIDGTVTSLDGDRLLRSDLGTFRLPPGVTSNPTTLSDNPVSLVIRADQVRFDTGGLGAQYDCAATGTVVGDRGVGHRLHDPTSGGPCLPRRAARESNRTISGTQRHDHHTLAIPRHAPAPVMRWRLRAAGKRTAAGQHPE